MSDIEEAKSHIRRLLSYFGGPVGVGLQELGRNAFVEHKVRVRLGDLIDARAFVDGGCGKPQEPIEPKS